MEPAKVIEFAKKHGAQMVDFKFMDFPGTWQHFGMPIGRLEVDTFEEGLGFDGSSLRGWQSIESSDMIMKPDPSTARMDPFTEVPTLSLICNIHDPITMEPYSRDPRNIARKAQSFLRNSGIADMCYVGPEAEFFIFDDVRFFQNAHSSFYMVDSSEGQWNSGRDEAPNLGYKPRHKEGYFPVPPTDSHNDIRAEICLELEKLGIVVEAQHHEVATGGQGEIDMRFASLLDMGDQLNWFKYTIKNVARRHGKTATFMPKPIFEDNGSGMHCHMSLWKDGKPLFAGDKYAGLSDTALYFIGGLLKHARSVIALTNPTTNSYKRLVPGFEAPVNLAYSSRNRSAAIRIPMYSSNPKAKRIEFRTPDPSCNGYLAFSAMLMAGLDGIENKIDPGDPMDKDIYNLSPQELAEIPAAPASLGEAMDALEKDHAFLTKGDVFTEDVIHKWIEYKRGKEVSAIQARPVPYEFVLYYDI